MAKVLETEEVGVSLKSFDIAAMTQGLERLLELAKHPATRTRCISAAKKHFSLEEGVRRYEGVYEKMGRKV